jgi:hypothetical protein
MNPQKVNVTVDGVKVSVEPGIYSFHDIVAITNANPKTYKFSVVNPTPATTINGNDSFTIRGGEAFTTTHN